MARIKEYDYDTANTEFVEYVIRRTGLVIGVGDYSAEDASEADALYQKVVRGKLQDAWELFRSNQ